MGGVGAPLITSVSLELGVPLDGAQWTLTITLFAGAIFAPVLGRLGAGPAVARPSSSLSRLSPSAGCSQRFRCRSGRCWPDAPSKASALRQSPR